MNTHKRRSPGGELGGSTTNETRMQSQTSLTQLPSRALATGLPAASCRMQLGQRHFFISKEHIRLRQHRAAVTQSPTQGWRVPGYGACLHLGGLQPSRPRRCVSSAVLLLTPQASAS